MLLKHSREPVDNQPVENTFIAIDERTGDQLGASVIYVDEKPMLYPVRPLQVRIHLDNPSVPDSLLGATIARAKEICAETGQFGRIYTHCEPDNEELMDLLTPFGFRDNDGLIRMQLHLPAEHDFKVPAGCTVVYDTLEDPVEQKYFLERYNRLFSVNHTISWLNQYIDRRDFMRILAVTPTGMAGEVLIWRESYSGVIGFIHTSKRWRRMGVATYLLGLACEVFEQQQLYCAETNIRARYPHMLKLLSKVGFEQSDLLMRYPGIDVNPDEE